MFTAAASQSLSRRSSFRLAGSAALGVLGIAACSTDADSTEPGEVDPLIAQADLARRDATTATAAVATTPDRAPALNLVAAERTAHADALLAEIARAAGTYPDGSTSPAKPSATPTNPPPPEPPPNLDTVRGQLAESQRSAADLARTESAYRAGLLGSISAAVAAELAVLLP